MSTHSLAKYEALLGTDSAQKLIALENTAQAPDSPPAWEPLREKEQPPAFPLTSFPTYLQEYVKALSTALQAPLDMVCCAVLGSLSVASLGASVQVKEDHIEPMQLYICISMKPSEGKSPVFRQVTKAAREWIRHENDIRRVQVAQYNSDRRRLEKQLASAEAKDDAERAAQVVAELERLEEVMLYEPPITDTTPEALGKAMMRNGGKASVVSAEGGITDVLMGSYSEKPNMDVILQGYSGEAVSVERIGRESIKMDHACCAMLLAVQPQVLEAMLGNDVLLARGLCARFLYCVPPSMLGKRNMRAAVPVPQSVASAYETTIVNLTALSCRQEHQVLSFSAECKEAYFNWHAEVESQIQTGGKWDGIANGWGGKLVGNTVRIAGLLHLAEDARGGSPISVAQFDAAIQIARYFLAQAIAATGQDEGLAPATRDVLEAILKQGQSPFSPYALRQMLKSRKRFRQGVAVDKELHTLQQAGFLRLRLPSERKSVGRPPEALYEVHPELLDTRT